MRLEIKPKSKLYLWWLVCVILLFHLFAWRYFVFSLFRMALFGLFVWRFSSFHLTITPDEKRNGTNQPAYVPLKHYGVCYSWEKFQLLQILKAIALLLDTGLIIIVYVYVSFTLT